MSGCFVYLIIIIIIFLLCLVFLLGCFIDLSLCFVFTLVLFVYFGMFMLYVFCLLVFVLPSKRFSDSMHVNVSLTSVFSRSDLWHFLDTDTLGAHLC